MHYAYVPYVECHKIIIFLIDLYTSTSPEMCQNRLSVTNQCSALKPRSYIPQSKNVEKWDESWQEIEGEHAPNSNSGLGTFMQTGESFSITIVPSKMPPKSFSIIFASCRAYGTALSRFNVSVHPCPCTSFILWFFLTNSVIVMPFIVPNGPATSHHLWSSGWFGNFGSDFWRLVNQKNIQSVTNIE